MANAHVHLDSLVKLTKTVCLLSFRPTTRECVL